MPTETNHQIFLEPNDPNIKIWRYMDFTKFVSLLDSKALYFARSDLFEDPFEGALSRANVELRPIVYKDDNIPPETFERLSKYRENLRKRTFINCWHMNERESAAMWKLYARSNEAIAIQSTFNMLHSCLPANTYLGTVQYIDYNSDFLPEGNMFSPFVHKRKSFEHEREVRALIQIFSTNPSTQAGQPVGDVGRIVPVNLDALIEKVYVAPTSSTWFADLVVSVMHKYVLSKPLVPSMLDERPIF
jgi:hypothetical protein